MFKYILIMIVFVNCDVNYCAKILGIFPSPGYSQFILGEKLMRELALKGHNVTVISPYEPNKFLKNYKTINIKEILYQFKDVNLFLSVDNNVFEHILDIYQLGLIISESTLKCKGVQNLLNSNETFDLIVAETFFTESLYAFSEHFNAPLVLFSSIGPSEWNNIQMGNVEIPSILPLSFNEFTNNMNFVQRLKNFISMIFNRFYRYFVAYHRHQGLINKYYPKKINLENVISNISLMLLNSHITTTGNYPILDNQIQIGGFHIENHPLDKDLKDFLDNAPNGVIYFSLGTNLKSSQLSSGTIKEILNVFSKLKQKILWKFEGNFENKPKNLMISKWLPQRDVLAHSNIKLFITHGGLISTTEAVFYGIPIIGIPIFGDQRMNIARAEESGFGIKINLNNLNEENLLKCIKEILENKKYKDNANRLSSLLRDQEIQPLDRAMFWIDFVLRQPTTHLRPQYSKFYWYQTFMLDIIFTLILILLISIKLFSCILKMFKQNKKEKLS